MALASPTTKCKCNVQLQDSDWQNIISNIFARLSSSSFYFLMTFRRRTNKASTSNNFPWLNTINPLPKNPITSKLRLKSIPEKNQQQKRKYSNKQKSNNLPNIKTTKKILKKTNISSTATKIPQTPPKAASNNKFTNAFYSKMTEWSPFSPFRYKKFSAMRKSPIIHQSSYTYNNTSPYKPSYNHTSSQMQTPSIKQVMHYLDNYVIDHILKCSHVVQVFLLLIVFLLPLYLFMRQPSYISYFVIFAIAVIFDIYLIYRMIGDCLSFESCQTFFAEYLKSLFFYENVCHIRYFFVSQLKTDIFENIGNNKNKEYVPFSFTSDQPSYVFNDDIKYDANMVNDSGSSSNKNNGCGSGSSWSGSVHGSGGLGITENIDYNELNLSLHPLMKQEIEQHRKILNLSTDELKNCAFNESTMISFGTPVVNKSNYFNQKCNKKSIDDFMMSPIITADQIMPNCGKFSSISPFRYNSNVYMSSANTNVFKNAFQANTNENKIMNKNVFNGMMNKNVSNMNGMMNKNVFSMNMNKNVSRSNMNKNVSTVNRNVSRVNMNKNVSKVNKKVSEMKRKKAVKFDISRGKPNIGTFRDWIQLSHNLYENIGISQQMTHWTYNMKRWFSETILKTRYNEWLSSNNDLQKILHFLKQNFTQSRLNSFQNIHEFEDFLLSNTQQMMKVSQQYNEPQIISIIEKRGHIKYVMERSYELFTGVIKNETHEHSIFQYIYKRMKEFYKSSSDLNIYKHVSSSVIPDCHLLYCMFSSYMDECFSTSAMDYNFNEYHKINILLNMREIDKLSFTDANAMKSIILKNMNVQKFNDIAFVCIDIDNSAKNGGRVGGNVGRNMGNMAVEKRKCFPYYFIVYDKNLIGDEYGGRGGRNIDIGIWMVKPGENNLFHAVCLFAYFLGRFNYGRLDGVDVAEHQMCTLFNPILN